VDLQSSRHDLAKRKKSIVGMEFVVERASDRCAVLELELDELLLSCLERFDDLVDDDLVAVEAERARRPDLSIRDLLDRHGLSGVGIDDTSVSG
jgi:hypothetical protein